MPDVYLPSSKIQKQLESLIQGFLLEIDNEDIVTIIFKLEASILTKMIGGCKFQIVLRNPKVSNRATTIYIYDNVIEPMFISWQEFGIEDEHYVGFDEIIIKLLKSTQVRVSYYNYQNIPVFTTLLPISPNFQDFNTWIKEIYSDTTPVVPISNGEFNPENRKKGYQINVANKDGSKDPKVTIFVQNLNDEIDPNSESSGYNFNDFLDDGKHGYNQEHSFESHIKNYFEINDEVYITPLKTNEKELIDFLIYYKRATILIESKFVLSTKQTKLNQAITKAIKQLNNAENTIKVDLGSVKDVHGLRSKLSNNDITLKFCLFNDNLTLDEKSCQNIIKDNQKSDLPIFISVTTFFQLIGNIKIKTENRYKYNFIQNAYSLYNKFLNDDNQKIMIIRTFEIHE